MNPNDNPSRFVRMLELLGQGPKTKKVLAISLGITERQVERILGRLESMFYNVDRNMDGEYFIFGAEHLRHRQFTESEREWMATLLRNFGRSHLLTSGILRKLTLPDLPLPLKESLKDVVKNQNIENLAYAIEHKLMVWLKPYHSPNNPTKPMTDRLVLPLEIVQTHHQLIAYERASRKEKTFKIDRILRVELTNETYSLNGRRRQRIDAFGFRGNQLEIVILKMTPFAAQLFREEYPDHTACLSAAGEGFECTLPIMSTQGVGRFVLGLPGEISVVRGAKLKAYLHEKMKDRRF